MPAILTLVRTTYGYFGVPVGEPMGYQTTPIENRCRHLVLEPQGMKCLVGSWFSWHSGTPRGTSGYTRLPPCHARGQGFKSPQLHYRTPSIIHGLMLQGRPREGAGPMPAVPVIRIAPRRNRSFAESLPVIACTISRTPWHCAWCEIQSRLARSYPKSHLSVQRDEKRITLRKLERVEGSARWRMALGAGTERFHWFQAACA